MLKGIVWILLLPLVVAAPSCRLTLSSDDAQRCSQNADSNSDLALHYCTAAIQSGRLSEAAFAGTLYNRGNAYDDKGDYDRAIQDLDQAIRLKPDDARAFFSRGLDRFFLAQFTAAQEDLTLALRNDRTNQYSAIWLYLARARNGQDGSGELGKNTATLKLTTWPGPVINFYLGKITSSALLQAANDADPKKDKEQHCEVNFYLGEDGLLRGQQEDAIRYFRSSLATGVTDFYEYRGAKAELKRMQVAQAADRQR